MAKSERHGVLSALAGFLGSRSKPRRKVGVPHRKGPSITRTPTTDKLGRGGQIISESRVNQRKKIEKGIRILETIPDSKLYIEDAALKYVNLGIGYKKLKDLNESNDCFLTAIEFQHATGFAYEKLAINLTKQGKLEEAIEVCKSLIDHPTIPKPRSHLTKEMMQKRMEKLQKKLAAEKPKGA